MLDLHYQIRQYSLYNSIKQLKFVTFMYKHNIKDLTNALYVLYTVYFSIQSNNEPHSIIVALAIVTVKKLLV
jgi:hypothetical protein